MAKEKVKYGLQNDKEIVEVLDRSENKMEIFKVFFFSSRVDRLFSLLKSTIILGIMFFTATLFFQKYLASYKYGKRYAYFSPRSKNKADISFTEGNCVSHDEEKRLEKGKCKFCYQLFRWALAQTFGEPVWHVKRLCDYSNSATLSDALNNL